MLARNKISTKIALGLIGIYQCVFSPMKNAFFGPDSGCRFYPSCSEYGKAAFGKYGFFKAFYFTFKRILRCHPFHPGGYDPVPDCCQFIKAKDDPVRLSCNIQN